MLAVPIHRRYVLPTTTGTLIDIQMPRNQLCQLK